ncbi:MAG: hypothetical protein ACQEQ4_03580 [Fibrobacterota bacterium]
MIRYILILCMVCILSCSGDTEVPACMEEQGVEDCHELFDRMQSDPANMELVNCYNKHCN